MAKISASSQKPTSNMDELLPAGLKDTVFWDRNLAARRYVTVEFGADLRRTHHNGESG